MQKKKRRISLMEKIRRALTPFLVRQAQTKGTREHRRWANGWKRHCATRSQMRRIGNRTNAIKARLIKA